LLVLYSNFIDVKWEKEALVPRVIHTVFQDDDEEDACWLLLLDGIFTKRSCTGRGTGVSVSGTAHSSRLDTV
jgi:hypothetical protein